MSFVIVATDPDGASYVLEYTRADTEDMSWTLLRQAAMDRRAMIHPFATFLVTNVPETTVGSSDGR